MVTIDDSFIVNHTCLRIKDPKVSIPFYEKNFGFKLIRKLDFDGFSLYMLNLETEDNKDKPWGAREGILELCHNHGTENDSEFKTNNGNGTENRGFGHIAITVDNIEVLESQLLSNGVKFQKKLSDGRQKNIAFALDPDGYWIELIEHLVQKVEAKTDKSTYQFNHSMIRVKDPKKSLEFYREKLGLKLFASHSFEAAKFTLYFLGYDHDSSFKEDSLETSDRHTKQALIELTHNWGTEDDENFSYHNGNSTDNGAIQGFGHLCVSCSDAGKFCKELEDEFGDELDWSVKWGKANLTPKLAFIRDPDGYSVEIFSHDLFSDDSHISKY